MFRVKTVARQDRGDSVRKGLDRLGLEHASGPVQGLGSAGRPVLGKGLRRVPGRSTLNRKERQEKILATLVGRE